MKPTREAVLERVILAPSGCWIWKQRVDRDGYGLVNVTKDGTRRTRAAHRVAFEVFVEPVDESLVLDHLCRVRRCVRPEHLDPVVPLVNHQRSMAPTAITRRRERCLVHSTQLRTRTKHGRPDGRICPTCEAERSRRIYARQKERTQAA